MLSLSLLELDQLISCGIYETSIDNIILIGCMSALFTTNAESQFPYNSHTYTEC